jgi:hypothetical protein
MIRNGIRSRENSAIVFWKTWVKMNRQSYKTLPTHAHSTTFVVNYPGDGPHSIPRCWSKHFPNYSLYVQGSNLFTGLANKPPRTGEHTVTDWRIWSPPPHSPASSALCINESVKGRKFHLRKYSTIFDQVWYREFKTKVGPLCCDATWTCRQVPTILRNMLPPSSGMFLRYVGIYLQVLTASQSRSPTSTSSLQWEPQILSNESYLINFVVFVTFTRSSN